MANPTSQSQYDKLYRLKDGQEVNAALFNPILKDIDRRQSAVEQKSASFDAERQKLVDAGINRLDTIMQPITSKLRTYASLGAMLTAHSASSIEVGDGQKFFIVDEAGREQFAPSAYLAIIKTGDPSQAMLGSLLGYSAETGQLVVDVDRFVGDGFHEDWTITAASATDNAAAIAEVQELKEAAETAAGQADTRATQAEAAREAALGYRDDAEGHSNDAHAEAVASGESRNQAQIAQAATEAARDAALAFMRGHIGSFTAPTVPLNRVDGSPLQEGDWYFKRVIGPPDTFLIDYVSSVGPTVWRTLTAAADTSVTSFNGRVGGVNPVAGDYSAAMVTVATIAGLAGTDVQAILASIKAALDLKALASRTVTGAGLVTGGGDASADRTLTVTKSSNAQAVAGTDDATAMTPLRTKEAILALAPAPGAATTAASGIVELATNAETTTGTDATRATTPAGVKAAIDAAIAAITGAAPSALDTFIEFANALGNDPNFATTVTTALSTKLASSSFTGANILALLLGVDGAGSGLDADLLDGLQAAYFRDASNLNAGTVPNARMKAGLQDFATLHADWNTALANGFWMGTAAANAPAALTGWSIGHVTVHNSTWVTQDVWDFTAAPGMLRYRRHMQSGVFTAWEIVQDMRSQQDARYPQITTAISAGTGLAGGGSFAASRTLSFDTGWGDARYIPRVGTVYPNSVDLNTVTTQGHGYLSATPVNAPGSGWDYASILTVGTSNVRTQYIARHQGDRMVWRSGSESGGVWSWGAWREMHHTGNLPRMGQDTPLDDQTFDASGTWTKAAVAGRYALIELWGAGAGGGRDVSGWSRPGGEGGTYKCAIVPFVSMPPSGGVVVGAGGAGKTNNMNNEAGSTGGGSSFLGLIAWGGIGREAISWDEYGGANAHGQGKKMWRASGLRSRANKAGQGTTTGASAGGQPQGPFSFVSDLLYYESPTNSEWIEVGTGHWQGTNNFGDITAGHNGGGGGGSISNTNTVYAPGAPTGAGGAGGAANAAGAGANGSVPGGGGGAGTNANGGNGGGGRVRIRIY